MSMKTLYASCTRGHPLSVVLEGGAGCGKTALLDLFAQYCTGQGAKVFTVAPVVAADRAASAQEVQHLVERMEHLSRDVPVVICRNDPQSRDEHVTRLLLDVMRRLGDRPVMLVLTLLPFGGAFAPALHRDLLRQPDVHRIRLHPLTQQQCRETWTTLRGTSSPHAAETAHAVSGGNPLLLHALAEEAGTSPGVTQWPQPHGLFVQEAVACIRESGPLALKVAAGMAALGESACPDSLATVLNLSPVAVDYGRNLLGAAGFLQGWHIRHPLVAAGILEALGPDQRGALDTEVAGLLYRRGAGPGELARLLLRTRTAACPWQLSVLEQAAAEALGKDDVRLADDCLALAEEAATECADYVRIVHKRFGVTMRTAPWTAAPRFLEQITGEPCPDDHQLCQARIALRARLLMECGRLEEGVTALRTALRPDEAAEKDPGPGEAHWPWIFQAVPDLRDAGALCSGAGQNLTDLLKFGFGFGLNRLSSHRTDARQAEEHLRTLELGDNTITLIVPALLSLIREGRPDLAGAWAAHFTREAAARGVEGWRQLLTAVRAEADLARGWLTEAEGHARDVLDACAGEPGYWLHGGPLAVLIDVCAATGRYEEATRLLDRPVPPDFAQSYFSLPYLMARGHFLSGLGRPHLALSDFLTVGRRAARWELPGWMQPAWRIYAAETWLRIGNEQECARLLAEHEDAASGTEPIHYGQWLRVRARLAGRQERPALLARAVERLRHTSGGWVLAEALTDLADAHRELGQSGPAEQALCEARQLAKESRSGVLLERIAALSDGDPAAGRAPRGPHSLNLASILSESELRVAALAARGSTNREISEELFITVSTVEQHLTRVYRKLDITSRQELPLYVEAALREAV